MSTYPKKMKKMLMQKKNCGYTSLSNIQNNHTTPKINEVTIDENKITEMLNSNNSQNHSNKEVRVNN